MKVYLANAFSLTMLPENFSGSIEVKNISTEEASDLLRGEFQSCVGHESTAQLLTEKLAVHVECRRVSISIQPGDTLIVAQLMGERKEYRDMSREEIEAYPVQFFLVRIVSHEEEREVIRVTVECQKCGRKVPKEKARQKSNKIPHPRLYGQAPVYWCLDCWREVEYGPVQRCTRCGGEFRSIIEMETCWWCLEELWEEAKKKEAERARSPRPSGIPYSEDVE